MDFINGLRQRDEGLIYLFRFQLTAYKQDSDFSSDVIFAIKSSPSLTYPAINSSQQRLHTDMYNFCNL